MGASKSRGPANSAQAAGYNPNPRPPEQANAPGGMFRDASQRERMERRDRGEKYFNLNKTREEFSALSERAANKRKQVWGDRGEPSEAPRESSAETLSNTKENLLNRSREMKQKFEERREAIRERKEGGRGFKWGSTGSDAPGPQV
jgi:hypothetical protein